MPDGSNGGRWALAGFLYQIVGILGITARPGHELIPTTKAEDEIDVLLNLADVGNSFQAYHEQYGQDGLLKFHRLKLNEKDKCILLQFKYSTKSPPIKIGRDELKKIIKKLDESAQELKASGQEITACVLITNRQLTSGRVNTADKLWEDEQKKDRDDYKLRHVLEMPMETFGTDLRRFAQEHGTTDNDIIQGVEKLVGKVLITTIEEPTDAILTKEILIEAFTGCRNAKPLIPRSVSVLCEHELDGVRVGLLGNPVRRAVLEDLGRISNQRALVVLHGIGGCGKTVTMWHWIRENGDFKTFSTVREVSRSWVVNKVCDWANLPNEHPWRIEQTRNAIDRLRIANPNHQLPIIHLGLDGLDEECDSTQKEYVKQIVRWFWDEDVTAQQELRSPRAMLVVTCRDVEYFKSKWGPDDVSGGFSPVDDPACLEVPIFSTKELDEAIKNDLLDGNIRNRIKMTIDDSHDDDIISSLQNYDPNSSIVDKLIFHAIRHPTIWRAFLDLDNNTQDDILDGNPNALGQLAKIFVNRFCQKVIYRERIFEQRVDRVQAVLYSIAQHCSTRGNILYEYQSDWATPSFRDGYVNSIEAKRLYSEALSGGLITEDGLRWRWSYDWVREFLSGTG